VPRSGLTLEDFFSQPLKSSNIWRGRCPLAAAQIGELLASALLESKKSCSEFLNRVSKRVPYLSEFIDIERRFTPLLEDEPFDALLSARCSVILGMQGSGKTTELRRARERLRLAGKACFLVRLETLERLGLRDSFDPEDRDARRRFDLWLLSKTPGIFLLDALDEATLPAGAGAEVLTGAMRAFEQGVGEAGGRCTLVITSRGSEWDHETDRRLLMALMSDLVGETFDKLPREKALNVYALAALSRQQVAALATARDIEGGAFVKAILDNRCQALARTPLEVGYLCDVWKEDLASGRASADSFSTRAKLFERATEYKLRPPAQGSRRSNLPRDAVLEGVEALAAATIICGVNDISLNMQTGRVIDPGDVLSGTTRSWAESELRQLLSFGFFAAEIAGRVRFAHREMRDFLAARYFDHLITQSGGALDCIAPLIARFGQYETIPGGLYNFFGWLATFNAAARRRVIALYPTLIMETGDPRKISPDDRARALRAHAAAYRDRVSRGHYFYDADLVAFSTPDLAPTLAELLRDATSPELLMHLLEIARCGRFVDLAEPVCLLACDQSQKLSVRTEALAALHETGNDMATGRALDAVRQTIASGGIVSPDSAGRWNEFLIMAARLATAGGGQVDCAREFLAPLARERRNGSAMAGSVAKTMVDTDDPQRRNDWIALLIPLILSGRSDDHGRAPKYVVERLCLLPAAASLLADRLTWTDDAAVTPELLYLAEGLCSLTYEQAPYRYAGDIKGFAKGLAKRCDIKAEMLASRWSSLEGDARGKSWDVIHYLGTDRTGSDEAIWHAGDVIEQLERAKKAQSEEDKAAHFHIARQIVSELRSDAGRTEAYEALVAFARQSGRKDFRRLVVMRWPRPFWSWWNQNSYIFRYDHVKRVWPRRVRDICTRSRRRIYDRWYRLRHAKKTARGEAGNVLAWAGRQHRRDHEDKGVAVNLDVLAKRYGRTFARRAEAGYRALWRKVQPGLPLNWGEPLIEAAALGLERDLQHGGTLQPGESAKAATIIFSLWGGAPDWAGGCLPAYAETFQTIARPAIRAELRLPDGDAPRSNGTISTIAYGPLPFQVFLANTLVEELVAFPDAAHETLRQILSLALHHQAGVLIPTEFIRRMAGALLAEGRFEKAFLWVEFWLRQDPEATWEWLEPWFGLWGRTSDSPYRFFLASYGALGQKSPGDPEPREEFRTCPIVLAGLLKAAYQVADPRTDNIYEDGYTPNRRDNCAETRRNWRERLGAMQSPEAHSALLALAGDPDLSDHCSDFLYHADRLALAAARHFPIPVGEVRHWLAGHSPVPHDRASYAAYVFRLAGALLERFAHSDHDEARPFRRLSRQDITSRDEADARNWLSARLAEAGVRVFEPVREAEVAEGNRTDIHLIARDSALGKVVLEVKLADRRHWTGDILVSTVELQLRDQYLRENHAHAGGIVLINTRRDGFAKEVAGQTVDFDGLCRAIKARIDGLDDGKTYRLLAITL